MSEEFRPGTTVRMKVGEAVPLMRVGKTYDIKFPEQDRDDETWALCYFNTDQNVVGSEEFPVSILEYVQGPRGDHIQPGDVVQFIPVQYKHRSEITQMVVANTYRRSVSEADELVADCYWWNGVRRESYTYPVCVLTHVSLESEQDDKAA